MIKKKTPIIVLIMFLIFVVILVIIKFNKIYYAEDFGIVTVVSKADFNNNGIDDYTDIMLGAKIDARNRPRYDSGYYVGGYPPDNIGVCTDVIWRAFKKAGYSLREMVDNDIILCKESYPAVKKRDKNIDFRRVRNLRVFFERYAIKLTNDIDEISQWQPGDIVIFEDDKHIGIVSDKRNRKGHTYIIHNGGQLNREEDCLYRSTVTGHYRFDASVLDSKVLVEWK